MKSAILARKITPRRFDLSNCGIDGRQAYLLLQGAYETEVISRGKEPQMDADTRRNLEKVSQWMCAKKPISLALIGKVGNGKTTMMHAVISLMEYVMQQCGKLLTGHVRIVHARDIAELYRNSSDQEAQNSKKILEALKNVDVLVIDDIGTEAPEILNYGNPRRPVEELLQFRYDLQKSTIISSNLDVATFREIYGERTSDRMREQYMTLLYNGNSYR